MSRKNNKQDTLLIMQKILKEQATQLNIEKNNI